MSSSTSFRAKSEQRQTSVAPIATVEVDKSDEESTSEHIKPPTPPSSFVPTSSNVISADTITKQPESPKYFLDDAFGVKNYQNFDEELFTFEEFLDYTDKPELTERIDDFHSIPLDSPRNNIQLKGKEINYIVDSNYTGNINYIIGALIFLYKIYRK